MLGTADLGKVWIYFNERNRRYSMAEYKTGASGPNIQTGTLEDYLDDYLGWFNVLGILIKSGQLTDEKAKTLFRYYLEMALKTNAVKHYLTSHAMI